MGNGYSFVCKKCGYTYDIYFGTGMLFPEIYKSCIRSIKAGNYGEEWKKTVSDNRYIAVDISDNLYTCKSCGFWKQEYSLSLYELKNKDLSNCTDYVMPEELKENYSLVKTFVHRCDICGKRMCKINLNFLSILSCPKCGIENTVSDFFNWD